MSYDYDPANNIDLLTVRQTTGSNNELLRTLTYNSLHEPLTDTDAAGQTTIYTYRSDGRGQLASVQNAKGETTTYSYGPVTGVPTDYLASITSPPFNGNSAVTSFTYDGANRVRTVKNEADDYTVTTDYDNLDRPTQISYLDGTNQQFEYMQDFGSGLVLILDLTKSTDRRGHMTTRHYNSNRQMDSITEQVTPTLNRTTTYGWCTCGALESITDPRGAYAGDPAHTTIFNRDLQSRLTSKVFPDNTSISYVYENTTSRLQSMTDALNQTTHYAYFPDDNLQMVSYTNAQLPTPDVSFTYDANYNRVTRMTDGIGTTIYGYYPVTAVPALGANQLRTVDGPLASDTITYSYDELGRIRRQSILGYDSNVTYDSLGRLSTSDNALGHFSRSYGGVTPRLQTLTYPDGQTANYSYFDNSHDRRLQTLKNLATGGVNLSRFDYTYDAEGQIQTWAKQLGTTPALTGSYGYDLADQLKTATTATVTAPGNYVYDYDASGNRTLDQLPPGMHSFNDVNQTEDPTYTYDPNGNLTFDGVSSYSWDAANRLIAIQKPQPTPSPSPSPSIPPILPTPTPSQTPTPSPTPQFSRPPCNDCPFDPTPPPTPTPSLTPTPSPARVKSEFSYDGLGRRVRIVEKQANSVDTNGNPVWITVSDNRYLWSGSTLAEERDNSSTIITKRFFAEGEQINNDNYYFTRDHLGSVREVLDPVSGAARAQYDYDPYGVRTKISGDLDADFGFTGHWHHGPSGLNLSLYRAYSATLGRWISRDPIGEAGGINLYGYVGNDSINLIDPLGLLVEAVYKRSTGIVTFKDLDTGQIASGRFYSGDRNANETAKNIGPIPRGLFEILNYARAPYFRLDALDANPGNDRHDPTGRDLFRLHGPGGSVGCVTARDLKEWEAIRTLISSTRTEQVAERRTWLDRLLERTITKYGTLLVEE